MLSLRTITNACPSSTLNTAPTTNKQQSSLPTQPNHRHNRRHMNHQRQRWTTSTVCCCCSRSGSKTKTTTAPIRRSGRRVAVVVVGAAMGCIVLFHYSGSITPTLSWMVRETRSVNSYAADDASRGRNQQPRRRQRIRRESAQQQRSPDATFNGGPVYLMKTTTTTQHTRVHCVGETYQRQTSWKDRSCRFDSLFCYNVSAHDFVIFDDASSQQQQQQQSLATLLLDRPLHHISSILYRHNESNFVSLGGINQKWGKTGIPRLKWFPRIINSNDDAPLVYYALPNNTVLIPFHSMNGANPGHLIWDDFLSMYTLASMFGLFDNNNDRDDDTVVQLLPIRFVLQDSVANGDIPVPGRNNNNNDSDATSSEESSSSSRGLWASCDVRPEKRAACQHMMTKFWPLIAGIQSPYRFASTMDSILQPLSSSNSPLQSDLVCSQVGLAGLGPLTDHGLYKAHGWEEADYKIIHNAGRGHMLYKFRNFLLRNMNMMEPSTSNNNDDDDVRPPTQQQQPPQAPFKIVFSQKSSDIVIRSMDFLEQIALVKQHFPNVIVENYIFKELSLQRQLDIATTTSIYVTLCGGGAATAMFLPKGASVIVYYADDGGIYNGKRNHKPALLDFDLFNAMSYLRVHWIPRNSRKTPLDDTILIALIQHEIDIMTAAADAFA